MRVFVAFVFLASLTAALWPVPKGYTHGEDVVWISEDTVISYAQPLSVSLVLYNCRIFLLL